MKVFHGDANGNTFCVLLAESNSETLARKYLHNLKSTDGWVFDSALILTGVEGTVARMSVHEQDGTMSMMCGNGALFVGAVFDQLGLSLQIETSNQRVLSVHKLAQGRYGVSLDVFYIGTRQYQGIEPTAQLCAVNDEPHAVFLVKNVDSVPIRRWGAIVGPQFNCTVVSVSSRGTIRARTFERGVNNITASCGTGACAASRIAHEFSQQFSRFVVRMHERTLEVTIAGTAAVLEGTTTLAKGGYHEVH